MGLFPGETSFLTLVEAVPGLLITHETKGINFTAHLNELRDQGTDQPSPRK